MENILLDIPNPDELYIVELIWGPYPCIEHNGEWIPAPHYRVDRENGEIVLPDACGYRIEDFSDEDIQNAEAYAKRFESLEQCT